MTARRVVAGPHAGAAAARNRGIAGHAETSSPIEPTTSGSPDVAGHLEALRRVPAAAVAYCWADHVDRDGRFVCPTAGSCGRRRYARLLAHNFIDTISTVAVRKSALDEVGGFDESLP